jgi:cation transport ATPase
VLLVDDLHRLLPGLEIARACRRIALESVLVGLGLSVAGMVAAAFGYLTPVEGALLQEAIDVAVILNALRALRIRPHSAPQGTGDRPTPTVAGRRVPL